jgi:hypothetical protein
MHTNNKKKGKPAGKAAGAINPGIARFLLREGVIEGNSYLYTKPTKGFFNSLFVFFVFLERNFNVDKYNIAGIARFDP